MRNHDWFNVNTEWSSCRGRQGPTFRCFVASPSGDTQSVDLIDRLLDDLAAAEIGTTFNPYRDTDLALDRAGTTTIRLGNLGDHLRSRSHPTVLLVGEAAGYAGCRFSGIAFTSERSLPPERRTSNHPRGRVEHSASIVHRVLAELELEDETVLWNVCPTHPAGSTPLSNRTPTRDELAAGRPFLVRLIAILQPALVDFNLAPYANAGNVYSNPSLLYRALSTLQSQLGLTSDAIGLNYRVTTWVP